MTESKSSFSKKVPTNTTAEARTQAGSLLMLADMMFGGNPSQAIERQEARGQAELVNSETLPADSRDKPELYAKIGVKLGELVEGDPMFRHATLPAGWKKVPTDHSMWSKVVDEQGRERIAIFYKAAFYDRSAHMDLVPRFTVRTDYVKTGTRDHFDWKGDGDVLAEVRDGGTVIYTTAPREYQRGTGKYFESADAVREEAAAWLEARYPNPRDPTLHWDAPPASAP